MEKSKQPGSKAGTKRTPKKETISSIQVNELDKSLLRALAGKENKSLRAYCAEVLTKHAKAKGGVFFNMQAPSNLEG